MVAARWGCAGRSVSGGGPPSRWRVGSQPAISIMPFPRQAQFQSTNTTRSPRKQRLSLRTSPCTKSSPFNCARVSAATKALMELLNQAAEHSPTCRNGSGSRITCAHPDRLDRRSSRRGNHAGAGVAATWRKVSSTRVMRLVVQGVCHTAPLRSSNTKIGAQGSSTQARMVGRKPPCTCEYTPYSVRSQAAVRVSVAALTNTDVPSAHDTIRRNAGEYPRDTGRHLRSR